MRFSFRKWTKVCEKSQKRAGEIFGTQDEVGESGTEILEVLCPDAACVGLADGWGVRACAAALTVGKDLLVPFPSLEKERKKVGLIFWLLFHLWKSNGKKNLIP